jgi:hypothetical protein
MVAAQAGNIAFVVQADWVDGTWYRDADSWNDRDYRDTWRLLIEPGSYRVLERLGEKNMADPQVVTDFIHYGLTNFEADRYGLVLWDHGGAIEGFGWDDSADNAAILPGDLASAIRAGMDSAGFQGRNFDLAGFDACLMANFETVALMAGVGDRYLASEETEPGAGWDYGAFALAATGGDADAVGEAIIEDYMAQCRQGPGDEFSSLALMDLQQFPAFDAAWQTVLGAVNGDLDTLALGLASAMFGVQQFGGSGGVGDGGSGLVDLGDLVKRLGKVAPALAASTDAFALALDNLIVADAHGAWLPGATGISIYWPFEAHDADFDTLRGSRPPEYWLEFLGTWHDWVADNLKGDAFVPGGKLTLVQGVEGFIGQAELEPSFVPMLGSVELSITPDSGGWGSGPVRLSEVLPVPPGGGRIEGSPGYTLYALQNGATVVPVHARILQKTPSLELAVPLAYKHADKPEREIVWRLSYAKGAWTSKPTAKWYEYPLTGTQVPECRGPDCLISPILETSGSWGEDRGPSGQYLPMGSSTVLVAQLVSECGTLDFRMRAKTLWGSTQDLTAEACSGRLDNRYKVEVAIKSSGPWDEADAPEWTLELKASDGQVLLQGPAPSSHSVSISRTLEFVDGIPWTISVFDDDEGQRAYALEEDSVVTELLAEALMTCDASTKKTVTLGTAKATITIKTKHCF